MTLLAERSFTDMPPQKGSLDWLLVPGGIGTRKEVKNEVLLSYIRCWCDPAVGLSLVMSVCTGSALLAAAGVLDGRWVQGSTGVALKGLVGVLSW
jgi:putative intracellular protease/amidase